MRSQWSKVLGALVALACIVGVVSAPADDAVAATPKQVIASVATATLSGSQFTPGLIISDSKFFNATAMTEFQIQDFLNGKVPNCTAGYVCLKSYTETTAARAANVCGAYAGGDNESASRIIFKVAQACGVNPQVILVTLQKEEGLITSTRPTAAIYRKAMGYGCPDTSVCDSLYYGFYNQVYNAARQFIRYGLPGSTFRYKIGNVAVQYSPNAACGAPVVTIRSRATAALYNYTPYQPNAAALANLTGVGDGCSSYGNRNFWVYFNSWFGSPTDSGQEQIAQYYALQGGAGGFLGAALGDIIDSGANGGGLYQQFAGGTIYWSLGAGPKSVAGTLLSGYVSRVAQEGALGWPTGDETNATSHGLTGKYQSFQNGTLYWTASLGAFAVYGATRNAYSNAGGVAGSLGWPTAEAVTHPANGGGSTQAFQGGVVYSSNVTGAFSLAAQVLSSYLAVGAEAGNLGWPVSDVYVITANGGGTAQGFQHGSIYYSPAAGAFPVYEPMRSTYWAALGEGGYLAWPTSAATGFTANGGGSVQTFQGGSIYASNVTGVFVLSSTMLTTYVAAGAQNGSLGWPASGLFTITANGGGTAQGFQFGSIYSSPASGTFLVAGPIRDYYWSLLGEGGTLGWPTAAQTCTGGGTCSQPFQNGTIVYTPGFGSRLQSIPQIEAAYSALGGPAGVLGASVSGVYTISANGGGKTQGFQNGSIYYSPATGAFAVLGSIRSAYWSAIGEGGYLAWPTSAQTTVTANGGGFRQSFQGGSIYSSTIGGTQIVSGPMLASYLALGGESGAIGWPVSGVYVGTANGGGTSQGFQNASMYSSAAGAFAVSGDIRSLYWSMLGEGGSLGWPISAAVCGGSGCTQVFQNGTIVSATGQPPRVQSIPQIETAYSALGGPTGVLGNPVSIVYSVSANGGGKSQGFQHGSIYYSPATGAFGVLEPIRAFYWSKLGEGGSLGWPTANQTCGLPGGGCSQPFQHGTILWSPTAGTSLQ
jgi:uncharacterized protein with LGFP repeats